MKLSKRVTPEHEDGRKLYVVLMVSRNKDNSELEDFKERRKSTPMYLNDTDFAFDKDSKLVKLFRHFVEDGVHGEMSRLYVSVNVRDEEKTFKNMLAELIMRDDTRLTSMDSFVSGIAAKKENRAESKWLIDFDSTDKELLRAFMTEVANLQIPPEQKKIEELLLSDIVCGEKFVPQVVKRTPHGYALVYEHGFDTRTLIDDERFRDVITIKRDDYLLLKWATNTGVTLDGSEETGTDDYGISCDNLAVKALLKDI